MKQKIDYCYKLIFLLFLAYGSYAQDPVLRHFTVEDGLPGGVIYSSMQDSKGYIWSATERGVTRFDGHSFKLFTIKDGLPSNDVWEINEDDKGRLWFNTFLGLCYFKNGKIKMFRHKELPEKIEKVEHFISEVGHFIKISNFEKVMYLDHQDSLDIFETKRGGARYLSNGFSIDNDNLSDLVYENLKKHCNLSKNGSFLVFDQTCFNIEDANFKKEAKEFLRRKGAGSFFSISGTHLGIVALDQLWSLDEEEISSIDLEKVFGERKNQKISRLQNFAPNRIWIKTESKNYVLDSLFQALPNFDFLNNYSINNLLLDRQGNLWISTNDGLFFLNEKSNTSKTYRFDVNGRSKSINLLTTNSKEEVWGLSSDGYLFNLDRGKGLLAKSSSSIVSASTDIEFDLNDDLWVGGRSLWRVSNEDLKRQDEVDHFLELISYENGGLLLGIKRIRFNDEGEQLLATYISVTTQDVGAQARYNSGFKGRFYDMAELKNGNYWVAGKNGLKLISSEFNEIDTDLSEMNPIFDAPINNIVLDHSQNLWLAVNNLGVYYFDGLKVERVKELDEILVASLHVDSKDRLWVSTNKGLAKISLVKNKTTDSNFGWSYHFEWITMADGLASNDVKEILIIGNEIFVATEKGLTILIDSEENKETNAIPIHFSNLQINGRDTLIQSAYELSFKQNNLLIEYECLNFQKIGSMEFQYQMEGVDENWVNTSDFQKEYPLLPPGNYTFRLRKKPSSLQDAFPPIEMQFNIKQPLWKRGWFLIGTVLLLCMLLYWFTQNSISKVKKKAEEETKLNKKFAELELRALQSQMNPHFIFNALHSIQDFIFKKDERIANRYLVKFSRLMRLFLESSKEKFILLEDEIQLNKLYIELEKLRFEDKFDFEIIIDDKVSPGMIEIPSMLLQPFVENAINHGLVHRSEPGMLTLSVFKENGKLNCRIEDNGVGRKKALEIKAKSVKSYKSRGTQLVEERQRVMNIIGNASIEIVVEDLYDKEGIANGTRVDVILDVGE